MATNIPGVVIPDASSTSSSSPTTTITSTTLPIGNSTVYVTNVNNTYTNTTVNRPGGATDEVQFRDSTGAFSGDAEFKYDPTKNVLTLDGNLQVTNVRAVRYLYANGVTIPLGYNNTNVAAYLPTYSGNLQTGRLTVLGSTTLGAVGNITITGGNSGDVLTTNGNGSLSWAAVSSNGNANYATYSGTALAVAGVNVSGPVGNANFAILADTSNTANVAITVAGANVTGIVPTAQQASTVTNPDQPAITTLGALTTLSVNGVSNLGMVSNVVINGGSNGQVLTTDGAGNLSWTSGPVGNANFAILADTSNTANVAITVAGANVTGMVPTAQQASTVTNPVQPAITTLGALTTLSVIGVSNLGMVSNVVINGGSNGQVLTTDGAGNLSWTTVSGNGGGNTDRITNGGNSLVLESDGTLTLPGSSRIDSATNPGTLTIYPNTYDTNYGVEMFISYDNDVHIQAANVERGIALGRSYGTGAHIRLVGNATYGGDSAGDIVVQPQNYTGGNTQSFRFGADGNLTLPGNTFAVNYANGTQVSLGGGSASTVDITNTNGLTTTYYPTFVENRTTGQIVRADVDLSYRTDTNTLTVGNISGNVEGYSIGYRDIPQIVASNATLALGDGGKHYYSTTAGNLTLTIPTNANAAFPTGTAVSIVVQAAGNVLVNAASGVTLYMAGNSTSGNRIVGTYGMATLMKVATDTWFINGTGVS